tara:strand:+ start:702 stop:2267 length:1566 start_codon:yes stop_codon:yes gene_type:complete
MKKELKYYFDTEAANNAVIFIEKYLTHTKGELAKTPFILQEYQKEQIIRPLFGWKKPDGTRKYRTSFIFLPRKNGKSTLAAAIILTLMYIDNEPGAEYYSAANDKAQAALVFDCAKIMIENNPKLSAFVDIFKSSIVYNSQGSVYKAISRESGTKHGFNVSAFIFDEIHALKDDGTENLYQILETATGSRRSPLAIAITTAGYNKNSQCWKLYDYAKRVKEGSIIDPAFLPVIFEADPDDDITDPETWAKANPGLGVSLKTEYMEREVLKASTLPSYENIFRRLHLNQWTSSNSRWIPDAAITLCNEAINEDLIKFAPCYGGLDLASTRDLTSFCLSWKIDETIITKHWTFVPEDKANARTGQKDGVNYLEWSDYLEITPGNVTDYNFVEAKILQLCSEYNVKAIAYDRWNSSQLVINLIEHGVKMSAYGMGYKSLSPATKELEVAILKQNFVYGNCPVMRWQFGNVSIVSDPAGNIKPAKDKSVDKIDTIISLIMSIGERTFTETEKPSVYRDKKGFFTI